MLLSLALLALVGVGRPPIDSGTKADTVTVKALKTAATPSACMTLTGQLFDKDMRTKKRATANENYRKNSATCGKRFDPLTIDTTQLSSATWLYLEGHLDRQLFQALDRPILAAKTDSARSAAILRAMSTLMGSHDYDLTPSWMAAEPRYLAELEKVPSVREIDVLNAHVQVSWTYLPGDSLWRQQVAAASAIAERLSPAERATDEGRRALCGVDGVEARGAAHGDDYQKAVGFLDHCLGLWPAPGADSAHKSDWQTEEWRKERREYAFIGQPVPAPLDAPHWLNAPEAMTGADLTQPVTLVEFTWTGCPECHKGYPTLRKLDKAFRAKGVHLMFMTYLFASTPQHDTASATEELAYDTWFWHEDKPIPFPIGVLAHPDSGGYPSLFNTYAVIGAPTYYIIDRHGVVQFVQMGHSADLEARLTSVITRLLADRTPSTS